MSAFTKILTVVLSLASIFLCGLVISYVASTNNVKAQYDKLESDYRVLQASKNVATAQANEIKITWEKEIAELKGKLATIEAEKSSIAVDLAEARNTAVKWQDRVNSWAGVVKSFEQTIGEMEKSLQSTRQVLSKEQEDNIKLASKLNEMTTSLDEHIVMLSSLRAENRRLLEQKAAIETKLAEPAMSTIPTQVKSNVSASFTPKAYVPLTGLIKEVSPKLVSITLGSNDGVREGMKFHVTRGTSFVADIVITDVDVDVAAGVFELKNSEPRVGDTVSNEL